MSVFDTSAIVAILHDENGRDVAESRLRDAAVSTVNYAEVLSDYVARRMSLADGRRALDLLGLTVHAPDVEQAVRAAELRAVKDLALGDRFCIALGEALGRPLVTSDQKWAALSISVPIDFIR